VLVLRLRQGDDGGLGLDSLTVPDNGIGLLERDTGMVFLEILRYYVRISSTGVVGNLDEP
jgi:hypothetical protein